MGAATYRGKASNRAIAGKVAGDMGVDLRGSKSV